MSRLGKLTSNLKIGIRIYAGFVVVLLLLLTLATVGYFSLGGVSGRFEQYATISDNTVRMTEIDRDVVSVRASMREYVRSGSPTTLKSLRDVGKEARAILANLSTTAPIPEQRERAKQILASLDTFVSNFDSIVKIQGDLDKALNEVMNPLAAKLSGTLADIIRGAVGDADMSVAAQAGIAQQQLMSARLSVAGFLQSNDAKLVEASEREFSTLAEALKRLNEANNDDGRAVKVKQVITETPQFLAAFHAAVKLIAERARLVDNGAKLAADMIQLTSTMKTTSQADLSELKKAAAGNIASTINFSIMTRRTGADPGHRDRLGHRSRRDQADPGPAPDHGCPRRRQSRCRSSGNRARRRARIDGEIGSHLPGSRARQYPPAARSH